MRNKWQGDEGAERGRSVCKAVRNGKKPTWLELWGRAKSSVQWREEAEHAGLEGYRNLE